MNTKQINSLAFRAITDEMYLKHVVEDNHAYFNSKEYQDELALEKLNGIKDLISNCPGAEKSIIDYYSQDTIFKAIVGTENQYQNLCNFIDNYENKEESNEVFFTIGIGILSGAILGIFRELTTTSKRYISFALRYNPDIPENIKTTKFRYNIKATDVLKAAKNIQAGISDVNKWISNPKSINQNAIAASMKKINIDIKQPSFAKKLKAIATGSLKAIVQGICEGVLAGGLTKLQTMIHDYNVGFSEILVYTISGSVAMSIVMDTRERYYKDLNKSGEHTIGELGWTRQSLLEFCKTLNQIFDSLDQLQSKLKNKSTDTINKEDYETLKAYINTLVYATKGLDKILIALFKAVLPQVIG